MVGRAPMGRRAGSLVAARAGWAEGETVGRVRPPALRPARYTCSGARSWSCLGSLGGGDAGRVAGARGVGRAQVAQHVLETLVTQHRALEPGRADVDAQEVEQVVRANGRNLGQGL